jgi:hypothetical protein
MAAKGVMASGDLNGAWALDDAFQTFVMGELASDRMLVGDGLSMGGTVVELLWRVDMRLKVSLGVLRWSWCFLASEMCSGGLGRSTREQ